MNHFLSLPPELQLHIGSKCSRNDLLVMCRVSKTLNRIYTEKLYEKVNLFHRITLVTLRRHGKFLKAIKHHREYSKHVQKIRWTITNLRCEDEGGWLPLLRMWDVLSMLTNVSQVKVKQTGIPISTSCVDVPEGLTLFPRANSISISGSLIDTIAQAILPTSKAGQLQRLRLQNFHVYSDIHMTAEATGPFLANLVGKCTHLQSIGVIHSGSSLDSPCRVLGTTCTIYASLIDSTRGTLKSLYYQRRRVHESDDTHIAKPIQQVLNHGSWPCLLKAKVHPKPDKEQPTT